ncbi:hypothetical protein B9Z55_001022 [Caenorhabditis nigoni]|uniref:Intein C-terminal splicing domain-containing protein n=1 Tax=Caenorhabditis nigoni TaxID=1611254 RepID=A0A2G5VDS0_9PELO|nr:hypothetical protein B9Z55_001022 [Caenorhabditis nigoni]
MRRPHVPHPSSLLCLLLLPLAVLEAAVFEHNPTHFRISGVLSCPHRRSTYWCFKVYLYEYDTLDKDELASFGVRCTDQESLTYNLNGYDDSDGPGDNYFELFLWIYHNCSLHGNIFQEVHNLSTVAITEKDVVREHLNYNVSVKGKRVDDWDQ